MKMKKISSKEEPGCCEPMTPIKMRREIGANKKSPYTSSSGSKKMPGGTYKVKKSKK